MIKFIITIALFFTFLLSCSEQKNKEVYSRQSDEKEELEADTLVDLPFNFTTDFIMEGDFHEGDVNVHNKSTWLGLFFNGRAYYLKETKVYTEKSFDPIMDDDSTHQTGVTIKLKEKDTSLFLISVSNYIKDRKVPFYPLKKLAFAPGEQLEFMFLGLKYKIYASGKIVNNEGDIRYKNYKLVIETNYDGEKKSTVLLAFDEWNSINFRDNFLFLGDIDGDGFIDVLMDKGAEYYNYNPTLLLSRKRSGRELVQPVGSFNRACC